MVVDVHVQEDVYRRLADVSRREQRPIDQIIDEALRVYERKRLWGDTALAYERLRQDPVAWKEYQDELHAWDSLGADGLENEEPYYTPEEEAAIVRDIAESEGR